MAPRPTRPARLGALNAGSHDISFMAVRYGQGHGGDILLVIPARHSAAATVPWSVGDQHRPPIRGVRTASDKLRGFESERQIGRVPAVRRREHVRSVVLNVLEQGVIEAPPRRCRASTTWSRSGCRFGSSR
jgi:hypothetical protein